MLLCRRVSGGYCRFDVTRAVRRCATAIERVQVTQQPTLALDVKRPETALSAKAQRKQAHLTKAKEKVTSVQRREIPKTAYGTLTGVTPIARFREEFKDVQSQDALATSSSTSTAASNTKSVLVAGRVTAMRHMGKVIFFTVRSNNESLQLIMRSGDHGMSVDDVKRAKDAIAVGDVISARGTPAKSKTGELSLVVSESPCVVAPYVSTDLVTCPDQRGFAQLQAADIKYRYRFLDMLSNTKTVDNFVVRHRVLMSLRSYLTRVGFVEVETPTFHSIPGGAAATPFVTRHHATDSDLYLRVAPELYLKQCVVGGMEKVFEVGRVFRNEDADYSHNPEFTSCEFYHAYANYEDLMGLTEELLRTIAIEATGSPIVHAHREKRPAGTEDTTASSTAAIDFAKPFQRVRVVPTLEERLQLKFPSMAELDTADGLRFLTDIFTTRRWQLPSVRTPAKLVDKLIDYVITDHVVDPTFVTDHPVFMSPLAKAHPDGSGLSERFELFINGMEICNAYSELTDPAEQYRRFEQQMRQRELGDNESQAIDDTFLKALQVGLPPTAGWGMGVDRLCMLLTGSASIRDVIIFPLLRPDATHDAKRRARTAGFFGFDQHMTSFVLKSLEAELERRGELRCCNQLRSLRHSLDIALRRQEACGAPPGTSAEQLFTAAAAASGTTGVAAAAVAAAAAVCAPHQPASSGMLWNVIGSILFPPPSS
jgi:lysyl-tRNA synthetase class 2